MYSLREQANYIYNSIYTMEKIYFFFYKMAKCL